MKYNFSDKIVIVTGGSRGIGANIVKSFHEAGANVFFTFLNHEEKARQLEDELGKARAHGFKVDSCNPAQIEEFITQVGKEYKHIDVLVNNAGIVARSLLASLSMEDWERSFNINLRAPFLYSTKALRFLIKAKGASIINITSVTADRASRGLGAYCATKAGLEALTKVLTLEYAPYKIRVNSVAPGLIETDVSEATSSEFRKKILNRTPLGRAGEPKEVSEAVLFLSSEKASFITGSQLYVTGGRHLE